jgi:hypothetical protein
VQLLRRKPRGGEHSSSPLKLVGLHEATNTMNAIKPLRLQTSAERNVERKALSRSGEARAALLWR